MKRSHLRRFLELKIPRAHSGMGTASATSRGYIGYALDAEFLLSELYRISSAYEMSRHPDYDPAWDDDPELCMQRLESWYASRVEDNWSFDNAGLRQRGPWERMKKTIC
jgi:hypothetical protein